MKNHDRWAWMLALLSAGMILVSACGPQEGTGSSDGASLAVSSLNQTFVSSTTPPVHLWSVGGGGAGSDSGRSVVLDSDGNTIAAGQFSGTVDFGGTLLTAVGSSFDAYVVKFDAGGTALWAKRFGDNFTRGGGVAVDSANNVVLAGDVAGSIDLGGGAVVTPPSRSHVYVAKFDPAGNHLWSHVYGDEDSGGIPTAAAVDGSGNIYVTGRYDGPIAFGAVLLPDTTAADFFLLKLDANGNTLWAKGFGGDNFDITHGIAVDNANNVVIVGRFISSQLVLGGVVHVNAGPGKDDAFVAKFDANGNALWSHRYGGTETDVANGVTTDSQRNVVFTGSFESVGVSFGGPVFSTTDRDLFLVKLDLNGAHLWSQVFGEAPLVDHGDAVAVHGDDQIVLAASTANPVDFGGGPIGIAGSLDLAFVQFDSAGNHQWSTSFGGTGFENAAGLALDGLGGLASTGTYRGDVDFGGGLFTHAGNGDLFVLRLAPGGPPNSPPVADAGAPVSAHPGDVVMLDGSGSSDPDGDPLTYAWTVTAPGGASVPLSDATAEQPTFTVQVLGEYVAELIVNDGQADSAPANVVISSVNARPLADAGPDQAVVVNDTVMLAGSGSDGDGDPLSFAWSFTARPAGSGAALSGADTATPTFVADVAGDYVLSLVVNDAFEDSLADTVTVTAVTQQQAAEETLQEVATVIADLPPTNEQGEPVLVNTNMANALTNKIDAVLAQIAAGDYQAALNKLRSDILKKTDGCATGGAPDHNDWILTCEDQAVVYQFVQQTIAYLEDLLAP